MGKDFGSWLHWKNSQLQSPYLNCTSDLSDQRLQDMTGPMIFSSLANPYASDSASRIVPGFPVSQFPQSWTNCYPNQICTPSTPKSMFQESYVCPQKCCETIPNAVQKNYLVFDQSGNRISVGYPLQVPPLTNPRTFDGNGFCVESIINRETVIPDLIKKATWCGLDEIHETDVPGSHVSEMHEDTEELDALLCSDDDYDDGDDEISTGHSPIDMTVYNRKEEVNDNAELTDSVTPTKKRRLGVHDPLLMDTASSGKAWKSDDAAESSCVKVMNPSTADKQMKKKRIRETVGILRSIIPGGQGKDATVVLDEAIGYLKSLKLKAKSLGATTTKQF